MKEDPYALIAKNAEGSPCLFTEVEGVRATWETTGSCSLGCAHCCVSATNAPSSNDITLDDAKKVVDELSQNGVTSIYVSGGEPLLWKPVYDLLNYIGDKGIFTSLATNGMCVDSGAAARLSDARVGKVLISLDSDVPDVHDAFRGRKGSYSEATRAAKTLSDSGIFVRVGHVIWRESVDNIERFAETMHGLGADEVAYNWLMPAGRARDNPEIAVPAGRYEEVGRRLKALKYSMDGEMTISYHRFSGIDGSDCMGGEKFVHVTPGGNITPCSWAAKLMPEYVTRERLPSAPLNELIASREIQAFRDAVRQRSLEFGPGCPAMCYVFAGSMMSPDPLYRVSR